jgi:hypothetical protein
MIQKTAHFPLTLCLAATLVTGLGLIASAANLQWGASPPDPDALQLAWSYVNIAWIWTWLLVWPALALTKPRPNRSHLLFDFLVILTAAIPALTIAAFLSATPTTQLLPTLAVQLATGLFTLGTLAHRRLLPTLVAGFLATLAVVMPIMEYLWAEFFPAANQSWTRWMPLNAITAKDISYEIAAVYAILGIALFLTVPKPTPQAGGAASGGGTGLGNSTSSIRTST